MLVLIFIIQFPLDFFVILSQNRDVRGVFRHLIGCLDDWELEKPDFSLNIKNPRLVYLMYHFSIILIIYSINSNLVNKQKNVNH